MKRCCTVRPMGYEMAVVMLCWPNAEAKYWDFQCPPSGMIYGWKLMKLDQNFLLAYFCYGETLYISSFISYYTYQVEHIKVGTFGLIF